jgi:hypothetical protein
LRNFGEIGARGAAGHDGAVLRDWRGPISVTGTRWTVQVQYGLPATYTSFRENAALVEEIGLDDRVAEPDSEICFVAVSADGAAWPALVVAQRYSLTGAGCDPGVALPGGGDVVFIGAGERLLAYRLGDEPVRLWEESCDLGFFCWAMHGDTVVMSAELELAPWSYTVEGARVRLDMMGTVAQFPLRRGPSAPGGSPPS